MTTSLESTRYTRPDWRSAPSPVNRRDRDRETSAPIPACQPYHGRELVSRLHSSRSFPRDASEGAAVASRDLREVASSEGAEIRCVAAWVHRCPLGLARVGHLRSGFSTGRGARQPRDSCNVCAAGAPQTVFPNAYPGGAWSLVVFSLLLGLSWGEVVRRTGNLTVVMVCHVLLDSSGIGGRLYFS
jgi:hypothetical protein